MERADADWLAGCMIGALVGASLALVLVPLPDEGLRDVLRRKALTSAATNS